MPKSLIKVWVFASSSDPNRQYQTLQYSDGSITCECPGWTRRVQPNGTRTCKHVRSVDQGRADVEALGYHDYRILPQDTSFVTRPKPTTQTRKTKTNAKAKTGSPSPTGYGGRKIIL